MWKTTFWLLFWSCTPYVVFFGFNRHGGIGVIPILVLGLTMACILCWYVLFRAGDLPKIDG
ncbi:MAG: hypothetical protein HY286_19530 [Planctomycetes bacterium]|nr:hypothetical protein [Planctomycetota bacterium]